MKQYLLIDIGGTFIKYSLADEQARKISGGKVPTPLTNMDDLLAAIEGFAAPLQGQFVGCAISMPGRIDTRNGIAHTGGMLSAFMWEQPFAAAAHLPSLAMVTGTPSRASTCAAKGCSHIKALSIPPVWAMPFLVSMRPGIEMASVPQQRRGGPVRWPVWRMASCWCWAPASAAASS